MSTFIKFYISLPPGHLSLQATGKPEQWRFTIFEVAYEHYSSKRCGAAQLASSGSPLPERSISPAADWNETNLCMFQFSFGYISIARTTFRTQRIYI